MATRFRIGVPLESCSCVVYTHIHIAYNNLGESKKRLLLGDFSYRFSYLSLTSSLISPIDLNKVKHTSMHLYEWKLFSFLCFPKYTDI